MKDLPMNKFILEGALNMKVLIADDSSDVRQRIITMLSDLTKIDAFEQAGTVQEAIAAIPALNPDVVILDIRMPGGSGIDVLKTIKKKNHSPVIIMLTNYPLSQYMERCLGAGADFFLDKSSDFEKIIDIIAEITAKRLSTQKGVGYA
jgi:DNA-binding NarL/FixJ family response regulator